MTKKKQLDELNRLVHLISDDNELLNRANSYIKTLVDNKKDITSMLEKQDKKSRSEVKPQ